MSEEEAKKRLAMIAKKQELLGKAVGALQERLFEAVLNQIETIAEDPAAMNRLFDEFTQNEHSKVLQTFAKDILSIGQLNAEYFIEAAANIGSKDYAAIQTKANDQILSRFGLSKEGKMLKGGFIDSFANDPTIKRELTQYAYKAKTSGAGLQEFKKGFRELITGTPEKNGSLLRHYNTFAMDSFQQVDAALQQQYSEELGLNAFLYLGGLIAGSRPFCNARNGKVFLKDEVEEWKNLDFAGKPSNYTPFLDRGGYNCRHILNAITPRMAIARRSDLEIDEDGRLSVKGTAKKEPTPEADTKTPVKEEKATGGFKPAESIKEAEEYAKKQGFAKVVDYKKATLETANAINRNMFDAVKDGVVYDEILISNAKLKKLFIPAEHRISISAEGVATKRTLSVNQAHIDYANEKLGGFDTYMLKVKEKGYWVSENLNDVLNHEHGHRLTIGSWGDKLEINDIQKKIRAKNIPISTYGQSHIEEGLAEVWALYKKKGSGALMQRWIDTFNEYSPNTKIKGSGKSLY